MSEQPTFTAGPWTILHQAYLGNIEIAEACDGEHESNAHLIAAAPDLYAACVDVLAQFDAGYFVRNTDSDGCSDWAIKAMEPLRALASMKAALAKADGR